MRPAGWPAIWISKKTMGFSVSERGIERVSMVNNRISKRIMKSVERFSWENTAKVTKWLWFATPGLGFVSRR